MRLRERQVSRYDTGKEVCVTYKQPECMESFGYISLVRISNWITNQATSVTKLEGGTDRHPGHAIPGGDGRTQRDKSNACLKAE